MEKAKAENIEIYTIGLGEVDPFDKEGLITIARGTGGEYFPAADIENLYALFDTIDYDEYGIHLIPGAIREEDNVVRDTDEDGLPDYYEKLINTGELKLGNGMCLWDFPGATQLSWADPNNQDSDGDGIPDGYEIEVVTRFDGYVYVKMHSNPCLADSDGDGINDMFDLRPMAFDTVITYEDNNYIAFNTGRTWEKVDFLAYHYHEMIIMREQISPDNPFTIGSWSDQVERMRDASDLINRNVAQGLSVEECAMIALKDNQGIRLYFDRLNDNVKRDNTYKLLTGRNEIPYFKYNEVNGLFDIPVNPSEIGFFKGKGASDAELCLNCLPLFSKIDYVDVFHMAGAVVCAMATAALITEATVAVSAIGEICGYFGVQTGLTMCAYVGVDGAYSVMQMSQQQAYTETETVLQVMDSGYVPTAGGGGATDSIKVGDTLVTFGHGGRHLEGTGLTVSQVNQTLANEIPMLNLSVGQYYPSEITINGTRLFYGAKKLNEGVIHIGTYYIIH